VTETILSAEAADRLGVNIQKFFRLVAAHNIQPTLEAPGLRGAKFWNAKDIDRLGKAIEKQAAA
jgi:hypothetical protein